MLKPIDFTVLVYVVSMGAGTTWTQSQLALGLGVSQSNIHRALKQLHASGLMRSNKPQRHAFRDVTVHAVRHIYPAVLGPPARGVATAHSTPTIALQIRAEETMVWPLDSASAFGTALEPLHPCVPGAAQRSSRFHELMALIDVIRVGRIRERQLAASRLDEILMEPA